MFRGTPMTSWNPPYSVQLGQGVDRIGPREQHHRQNRVMGPSIVDNLEVHLICPGADVIEEEPVSDHPVEPHSLLNVRVPRAAAAARRRRL